MMLHVCSILAVALLIVGCSSKPQPLNATVDQSSPNTRHWEGATKVLKEYRLPEATKAGTKGKTFGFAKQSEVNTKKGEHK